MTFYSMTIYLYYMGRKKLNRTREELLEQQRVRAKRYYEKHKQRLNKNSLQRYYKQKNKWNLQNNK